MSSEVPLLVDLGGGRPQLAGKVLGEHVFKDVITPALGARAENAVLILSMRDVAFVTSSFLKATWLQLHPESEPAVPSMVAHLSEDVRTEFGVFLRGHARAGLEAVDWSADGVLLARVHGQIEVASLHALRAVLRRPGSTAPELHAKSREGVSATAWTNRLNELHRQGLVCREKAGRAWRFFPIAKEIEENG
jgi:hypothetical protein